MVSKMNLYEVLGVERNASQAAIKYAYRKRVKTAHPDHGGTVEEFRDVHLAWRILQDPERRRKYDHSGDVGEDTDNRMAMVLTVIGVSLDAAVQEAAGMGGALNTDLVALMVKGMVKKKTELEMRKARETLAIKHLEEVRSRFSRDDDQINHIELVFLGKIAQTRHSIADIDVELDSLDHIIELVKGYKYRKDAAEQVFFNMHTVKLTTS